MAVLTIYTALKLIHLKARNLLLDCMDGLPAPGGARGSQMRHNRDTPVQFWNSIDDSWNSNNDKWNYINHLRNSIIA